METCILAFITSSIGLGTAVAFSSSHWILAWVGLEVNTLAILPIMSQQNHPRAVEATTKYFMVQATASATLLFASLANVSLAGNWDICQTIHPLPTTLVVLALSLKLGLAPLHTWLPEVLQGLSLTTGLIISTWQKLAPFSLLLQLPLHDGQPLLLLLSIASIFVGGWGGMNQVQLRKLVAYSSIAHVGWMLIGLNFEKPVAVLAIIVYVVITCATILLFSYVDVTAVSALAASWSKTPILTMMFPLVILSLGGLPPLTGFMPKLIILQQLTAGALAVLATIATLGSLISLYYYLRMCYTCTLAIFPSTTTSLSTWRVKTSKSPTFLSWAISGSILFLPLTPSFIAFCTLL